jgi:hypothetical protein
MQLVKACTANLKWMLIYHVHTAEDGWCGRLMALFPACDGSKGGRKHSSHRRLGDRRSRMQTEVNVIRIGCGDSSNLPQGKQ